MVDGPMRSDDFKSVSGLVYWLMWMDGCQNVCGLVYVPICVDR